MTEALLGVIALAQVYQVGAMRSRRKFHSRNLVGGHEKQATGRPLPAGRNGRP